MENNKRPNQVQKVLSYMRTYGSITSREAFFNCRIQSLPKRICEIVNQGFYIKKVRETGIDGDGNKVSSIRYYLIEEPNEVAQ